MDEDSEDLFSLEDLPNESRFFADFFDDASTPWQPFTRIVDDVQAEPALLEKEQVPNLHASSIHAYPRPQASNDQSQWQGLEARDEVCSESTAKYAAALAGSDELQVAAQDELEAWAATTQTLDLTPDPVLTDASSLLGTGYSLSSHLVASDTRQDGTGLTESTGVLETHTQHSQDASRQTAQDPSVVHACVVGAVVESLMQDIVESVLNKGPSVEALRGSTAIEPEIGANDTTACRILGDQDEEEHDEEDIERAVEDVVRAVIDEACKKPTSDPCSPKIVQEAGHSPDARAQDLSPSFPATREAPDPTPRIDVQAVMEGTVVPTAPEPDLSALLLTEHILAEVPCCVACKDCHQTSPDLFTPVDSYGTLSPASSQCMSSALSCTSPSNSAPDPWPAVRQRNFSVELPFSTLVSPRSLYEPFEPPAPELPEWKVVEALSRESRCSGLVKDGYMEFDLTDFAIYIDSGHYPNEMRALHFLDTRPGHSRYYFDGCLSVGDLRYFVKRVPIAALPIGGYMDLRVRTVRGSVWLQSQHNSRRHVYYRLSQPASEYARFYEPFIWVADLAKHFVDYLDSMQGEGTRVSIHSFKSDFSAWLLRAYGSAPELLAWGAQHPSGDFRTSVAAHAGFLHKEAYGVLGQSRVGFHTLWKEVMLFTRFKREPTLSPIHDPTVVTEYIRDCFSHLPFGNRLESIPLSETTKRLRRKLIRKRRLEMPAPIYDGATGRSVAGGDQTREIRPGDTISTHRDDAGSGTKWKRERSIGSSDVDRWFARVQKIGSNRRGQRVFDVIWYYQPVDTLCGLMKYPWSNEIFLSDHCSCGESSKITEEEVLGVHEVELWGTAATPKELFCRQTYISGDRKWVTLEEKHLWCEHVSPGSGHDDSLRYCVGDTVLVHLNLRSERSEPCEIVSFDDPSEILLRRLVRRRDIDASSTACPPNELLWTDELAHAKRSRILSRCQVRFFSSGADIPPPYSRGGVGAFFFFTHRLTSSGNCQKLEAKPASLRQGLDPDQELPRLRGLDLFCGGGNFGRGLEEGGAIEMRWLNDFNEHAVHTYMANVENPGAVTPFLGSIDDMQRQAMLGQFSDKVPRIGEVDFISAGSPCPGFSTLTNDKTTAHQRKNQSLVAAFGSFVDLYRPQYGLLENVRGIVQKKSNRDQDVFSQLICAIVGLGYQTRFFFLDASSCGAPQSRGRVFLAFAAPGCRLPNMPQITHSHPPGTKSLSLGLLPNGEAMAEREVPAATPFKFVSAAEACDDLPGIYDAKPDTCIPYPDHRVALGITKDLLSRVKAIPTQPWAMNFALAWYGTGRKHPGSGVLTQADRALFPADRGARSMGPTLPSSHAYGRMAPNRPLNTIVTSASPGDAKNGQQMHWREPRVITLMEARRAQGFRDHEVLLGSVAQQYRMVGNSVAREVAVALGLMFREAEFGSLTDGEEDLSRPRALDVDDGDDPDGDDDEQLDDRLVSTPTNDAACPITKPPFQESNTPGPAAKRAGSHLVSFAVEIPVLKRPRHAL